jgi:Phosphotransferase enzyme family
MSTSMAYRGRVDPGFDACARAWLVDRLAARDSRPTGPIELVRARPWSVIYRAATDAGPVWFKANTAATAYEGRLVAALAERALDAVLRLWAVDPGHGWMLSPDAGPTLRDTSGSTDLSRWEAMLRAYAELQRLAAGDVARLRALGVPDLRPGRMPALLAGLLDDPAATDGLADGRLAAIGELTPRYARWCAELAADGVPDSVQHDDLSDGNVFVSGDRFRFFDWGDASVAHPFGSLLVALSVAAFRFKLPARAPELLRLRDAYLEPWSAGRDRPSLLRSATLAGRITRVSRALAWQRALSGGDAPVPAEYATAVSDWLGDLTEPDPF